MTPPCHGGKASSTLAGSAMMKNLEPQFSLSETKIVKNISISEVPFSSIPREAQNELREKLDLYRKRQTPDREYDAIYRIDSHDGIVSYACPFTFGQTEYIDPEKKVDLVDCAGNRLLGVGSASLMLNPESDYQKDQPFVRFTKTSPEYRREGLGIRRLQLLDALCKRLWSFPLRSSDSILPEARAVWEKLCELGLAEIWRKDINGKLLYRFKEQQAIQEKPALVPQKKNRL